MMIIPFHNEKINPFFQKNGVDRKKFIFYSQTKGESAKNDGIHLGANAPVGR